MEIFHTTLASKLKTSPTDGFQFSGNETGKRLTIFK